MSTTNSIPTFETNRLTLANYMRANRPDLWDRVRTAKVFTGQQIPVWVNGEVVQKQDTVALVNISDRTLPYYLGLVNHPDGSKELQHVVNWKIKR